MNPSKLRGVRITGDKVAKELTEVNISFASLQKIRRIAKQNFSFEKH
jgi:hypothetical protein